MIEQQLRPWLVSEPRVLEAFARVDREDFVPAVHRPLAFADLELPLPGGQWMLSPKVQGRLLQDADVKRSDKVLEIGTGTGYMTALLASLGRNVLSLEIVPELVRLAQSNLQCARIHNAEVRLADGSQGAVVEAPFDVILLSGSVAEVPQSLWVQLAEGGRLIAVVGVPPIMHAQVIVRTGKADYQCTEKWDIVIPKLLNFPEPDSFRF